MEQIPPPSGQLNDPLQADHLGLLLDRIGPELAKKPVGSEQTVGEQVLEKADVIREDNMAQADPTLAAFLASQGVRRGEIDDEIALRTDLYNEDARRRSETYARAADKATEGIGMDFENRGLFRSAARLNRQNIRRDEYTQAAADEQYTAQRAYEERKRALENQQAELDRQTTQRKVESGVLTSQQGIDEINETKYNNG